MNVIIREMRLLNPSFGILNKVLFC